MLFVFKVKNGHFCPVCPPTKICTAQCNNNVCTGNMTTSLSTSTREGRLDKSFDIISDTRYEFDLVAEKYSSWSTLKKETLLSVSAKTRNRHASAN